MQIVSIFLYPVKSGAPLAVESAIVEARGLAADRRWMIVDKNGVFITGRQFPQLTLLRGVPSPGGLVVSAPGMLPICVAPPSSPSTTVQIWKKDVGALVADGAANEWISRYLGIEAKFVFMGSSIERQVDPACSRPGDLVSYADSCPVMLLGDQSLALLNSKLAQPVTMMRFRPNIVVTTSRPHEEDEWQGVSIGGVDFDVAKACTRCNFVNVDPDSGTRSEVGEPLKTLTQYRRSEIGVTFGRHLIPRGLGEIRVGDELRVSGAS